MNSSIPFLDLITPHAELESELIEVVRTALHSASFIGGERCRTLKSTSLSLSESRNV